MSTRQSRSQRREKYNESTRISLLEDDVDDLEFMFAEMRQGQRRIQQLLWSIISALLVATTMLAINLAVAPPVP